MGDCQSCPCPFPGGKILGGPIIACGRMGRLCSVVGALVRDGAWKEAVEEANRAGQFISMSIDAIAREGAWEKEDPQRFVPDNDEFGHRRPYSTSESLGVLDWKAARQHANAIVSQVRVRDGSKTIEDLEAAGLHPRTLAHEASMSSHELSAWYMTRKDPKRLSVMWSYWVNDVALMCASVRRCHKALKQGPTKEMMPARFVVSSAQTH